MHTISRVNHNTNYGALKKKVERTEKRFINTNQMKAGVAIKIPEKK